MASPNSKVRSNAVGEISGDGVKIFRPDGGTLELKGTPSNTDLTGLVTVSANKTTLSVSRFSSPTPGWATCGWPPMSRFTSGPTAV